MLTPRRYSQGEDPTTDFRGAGLLGLEALVYFAEREQEVVRRVFRAEPEYPFAASTLAIVVGLAHLLRLLPPAMIIPQQQVRPVAHPAHAGSLLDT